VELAVRAAQAGQLVTAARAAPVAMRRRPQAAAAAAPAQVPARAAQALLAARVLAGRQPAALQQVALALAVPHWRKAGPAGKP